MKKILLLITLLVFPFIASADDNISKIFKIISYDYHELTETFIAEQYGSSVYLGNNLLITNAHVVLNDNNKPTGNYEICKTISFRSNSECFSAGELLYYNIKDDLAILKISNPGVDGVSINNDEINIGDDVKVYGYPRSGGETISFTQGKVSGYEKGLYKIDANIDSGNSGGGVFDNKGNLIGISVSVVVGFTTMGYIIPISDVNDFINKKGDITYYKEGINNDFNKYLKLSQIAKKGENFNNPFINIEGYKKYNFDVSKYIFDINKNYFNLSLVNDTTGIIISNNNIIGNNIKFDDIIKREKNKLEGYKKNNFISKYKTNKIKLWGNDAFIYFIENNEGGVNFNFIIKTGDRQFINISIYTDDITNKEFLHALIILLKHTNIKNNENTDFLSYNKFDNLKINNFGDFYIEKSLMGDFLISVDDDIYSIGLVEKFPKNIIEGGDYTLFLHNTYDYNSEIIYFNEYTLKQTNNGDIYIYMFGKNNKSKFSDQIIKDQDKYFIKAYLYEFKDSDNIYENTFTFTFNKSTSKDKIDNFLNNIEIFGDLGSLDKGDFEINKNLIKDPDFKFDTDVDTKQSSNTNIKINKTSNFINNKNETSIPITSISLESEKGDYIGQGKQQFFDNITPKNIYSKSLDNAISFNFNNFYLSNMVAEFESADGQKLTNKGLFYPAKRYPFNDSYNGINISGDGRGCNKILGGFYIHEYILDGDKLDSAAIDFVQYCEGNENTPLYGSIRYNSTKPSYCDDNGCSKVKKLFK